MKCVKFRTGSTNGLRRAEHLVLFHPREHQRGQGHRSQASVPETGSFSTFLLMGYEDLCQQILHYAGSLLRLREEQQMRQPTNVILMAGEAAVLLCLCVLPMLIRKPPSHCDAGCWITATGSCHYLLKAAGRACRDTNAPSHVGLHQPRTRWLLAAVGADEASCCAPSHSYSPCSSSGPC